MTLCGHWVPLEPLYDTILIGYGPNEAQCLSDNKIYFDQEHMLSHRMF
jgi:hypothetical protein